MLIRNGNVLLFEESGFVRRNVRVDGGRIAEVASGLMPRDGEPVVEAEGLFITPGLIDAHSHICISEEGMGSVCDDCNDYSNPVMPYLDTIDGINPFDRALPTALAHGVTAACVCPGSGSVVGGVANVISLKGRTADEMILKRHAAMKCSFGENPKLAGFSFKSRMGNAYLLRKCLEDALDYRHTKDEAQLHGTYFKKDLGMENMLLVLNGSMPLHAHAHRADDICTAIRIAQEYSVRLVIVHGTDGARIADYLGKAGYPVISGPSLYPKSKIETLGRSFASESVLDRAGVKLCITADHDVMPIYYLSVYAAQAVREGLPPIAGLKAITKTPAEVLGIDDRKGEIRVGRDADIALWTDHPLSSSAKVVRTYIEGEEVFSASEAR